MADITRLDSKVTHCKDGECFWNGKEKGGENFLRLENNNIINQHFLRHHKMYFGINAVDLTIYL